MAALSVDSRARLSCGHPLPCAPLLAPGLHLSYAHPPLALSWRHFLRSWELSQGGGRSVRPLSRGVWSAVWLWSRQTVRPSVFSWAREG